MSPSARLRVALVGLLLLVTLLSSHQDAGAADKIDKKAIQELAKRWFKVRPWTWFDTWDPAVRRGLLEEAAALGPIPEGSLEAVRDLLWKAARKAAPKLRKTEFETPYGTAEWIQSGRGGKKSGLILGLHGGGEGAGSASEPAGKWSVSKCMGMYPQGIRLVHDTWNTVHGERFLLTLIEIAKLRHEIDPDRVYVAGFSMGGTGSYHMAGRFPDLFAGAIPAHGVLMASPKSKLATKEEVESIQNGILPNLRNVPVYIYTGLADENCEPGTFLYAWDRIQELREADPGGYADIQFKAIPGLAHAFPPGEPSKGLKWIAEKRRDPYPEKIVWEYAAHPFPMPDEQDKVARIQQEWFYWLQCALPADGMQVIATRNGNEFHLESVAPAFPEDFSILLNPDMIDVEEDVVVLCEGKEVYRGKPVPDVATILETLDARFDRRLLFDRRVRIPEQE
jgi:dienelactone hydrolase